MDVTNPVGPFTRAAWRAWLTEHHASRKEAWLLFHSRSGAEGGTLTYLDAVEEAICFGWIDGLAKRHGAFSAQRFTPRRPKGNWTELNKERARRLIAAGLMTDAGRRALPDLDPAVFRIPPDIAAALQADAATWAHFQRFDPLYQRVRVGYVEEMRRRDPAEFQRRLQNLVEKTRRNEQIGRWDDTKLARSGG